MKFVQFFVTVGRRVTIDYKFRDNGATLRHLVVDEDAGNLIDCLYSFGEDNFVYLQSDLQTLVAEFRGDPKLDPETATDVLYTADWESPDSLLLAKDWDTFCNGEYYHDDALKVLHELQAWMRITKG